MVRARVDLYDILKTKNSIIDDLSFFCSTKTDILLGKNCGLKTLMVGSGVDSIPEANRWKTSPECSQEEKDRVPDFTIAKLGDLLPIANSVS